MDIRAFFGTTPVAKQTTAPAGSGGATSVEIQAAPVRADPKCVKTTSKVRRHQVSVPEKSSTSPKLEAASKPPVAKTPTADSTIQDDPKPKPKGHPWFQFQERPDPPLKGQKPLPVGRANCLSGKVFHLTGVLDSLERDEAVALIQEYGGQVAKTLAKKVTHAIVGLQASEKKEAVIAERNLPVLNEDDLFEMIKSSPAPNPVPLPAKASRKKRVPTTQPSAPSAKCGPVSSKTTPVDAKCAQASQTTTLSTSCETSNRLPKGAGSLVVRTTQFAKIGGDDRPTSKPPKPPSELWPDKWRPRSVQEILGNGSAIQRLCEWLGEWNSGKIPVIKAVLLSGPPGVGKSSAAAAMCAEFGYEPVEFNASDARNKSNLDSSVANMVANQTMDDFVGEPQFGGGKRICVVMDEVDGMSEGDRGGMARLCQIIDATRVPIVCICNDRSNPKLRSLKSRCKEIVFSRPTAAQAMPRLTHIASREKLDIDRDRLALLFASTNGDLRQTLNLLQWTALKPSNGSEGEVEIAGKDVDLGAFDAVQKLMDPREKFTGKLDYYFVDTSMVPLLVQENYLASSATQSRFADLERFAAAADSISAGDLINQTIYAHSNWTLDEIHGMVSTVAPCVYASRSACVRLNFPGWLAKYGPTQRHARLLTEMSASMSLSISATHQEIRLDYLLSLRRRIVDPLERRGEQGVSQVIEVMNAYSMSRSDWDTVVELTALSKALEPRIDSKVKTKFTREYRRIRPLSRFLQKSNGNPQPALKAREVDAPDEEREQDSFPEESPESVPTKRKANPASKKTSTAALLPKPAPTPKKRVKK